MYMYLVSSCTTPRDTTIKNSQVVYSECSDLHRTMASRPGTVQRPNGIPREKICQFKLVLLGELVVWAG